MVNYYKQLGSLKSYLEKEGYKDNIPIEVFKSYLMLYFGYSEKTTLKWISNFKKVKLIVICRKEGKEVIKWK